MRCRCGLRLRGCLRSGCGSGSRCHRALRGRRLGPSPRRSRTSGQKVEPARAQADDHRHRHPHRPHRRFPTVISCCSSPTSTPTKTVRSTTSTKDRRSPFPVQPPSHDFREESAGLRRAEAPAPRPSDLPTGSHRRRRCRRPPNSDAPPARPTRPPAHPGTRRARRRSAAGTAPSEAANPPRKQRCSTHSRSSWPIRRCRLHRTP